MKLIQSISERFRSLRRPRLAKAAGEDVFVYAERIAGELGALRATLAQERRSDLAQRIDRDLEGYPPRVAVPSYRRVTARLEGELSDGTRSMALPPPTSAEGPLALPVGLRHLRELPALAQAVNQGAEDFLLEIQPPFDLAYGRTLYPEWRGWKITRLWHRVPVREVEAMIERVGTQAHEMRDAPAEKGVRARR